MHTAASPDLPASILEEALGWAVRMKSGTADAALIAACEAWRAASPLHERAWRDLQVVEREFSAVPRETGRLAADALERSRRRREAGGTRRKALKLLGVGALGVATAWVAGDRARREEVAGLFGADYSTEPGERRSIALADGSQLLLNTGTALDVRLSAEGRLLVLRRGEIFIRTGKDEDSPAGYRPLRVETAQARLEALGTRFHVRQEGGRTRLHVEEGAVRVELRDAVSSVVVRAGEEVVAEGGSLTRSGASEFDFTAWTDGALVAKQMRLADFTAELARYRAGWLRCDPAAADLRVSGVFQLDDTDRVLQALTRSLPVRIERRTRYWVTVVRR